MTFIPNQDPMIERAIRQILGDYGDNVSVESKNKALYKFGRNLDVTTALETVWLTGGIETLPTGNNIDNIVSTAVGDTQSVTVEGHTLSAGNLTFVTQTLTLTGTTNFSLVTPLARCSRLINNGTTSFAGIVTVADLGTSTHITCPIGINQSKKCATSLSQFDYWIITGITGGVNKTQTRSVNFSLDLAPVGGVFRSVVDLEANSSSGSVSFAGKPYFIVPPNYDVRIQAISSGAATEVSAWINGHLAIIV